MLLLIKISGCAVCREISIKSAIHCSNGMGRPPDSHVKQSVVDAALERYVP
jgi:hypothetical protein